MRKLFILPLILISSASISQEDEFKLNFDVNMGVVSYYYDVIENNGYSFSSQAWDDTVHNLNPVHANYSYVGVNALLHFGVHFPIIKKKNISFGFNPKVGIGRLIQISPRPSSYYDYYGYETEDSKRISSGSYDVEAFCYLQYNLLERFLLHESVRLYGGYRFIKSHDNYSTPVIGLEYSGETWSVGAYSHLFRMNYYREFSDGTKELAKRFHEAGLTLNYYLGRDDE